MSHDISTAYITTERATLEELRRQSRLFDLDVLRVVMDATIEGMVVLNTFRQVVHANYKMLELSGETDPATLLGKRPGEILHCGFAMSAPGGCGTTEACRQCGALKATLHGLLGLQSVEECRVVQDSAETDFEAFDLRVRGTPFEVRGEPFVILALQDISHEKRRRVLERIFFHDILNTAGGLRGFVEMLHDDAPEHLKSDTALLQHFLNILLDEINAHKLLLAAETGELKPWFTRIHPLEFLQLMRSMFESHEVAKNKTIEQPSLDEQPNMDFNSDPTLLRRVLGNLLKNALEATPEGGTVRLGWEPTLLHGEEAVRFWVHNAGVIPPKVQREIFRRSFSTKGEGRGVGAYSVKLLTERYLGGRASFISTEGSGTIFRIDLPRSLQG